MTRKEFGHWASLMIDAAPSYVTSGTPAALMATNELLTILGSVHATVGWQVQALSYALVAGNFLRRGLESGLFVRQANRIRKEWHDLHQPVALSTPWPVGADSSNAQLGSGSPTRPPPGEGVITIEKVVMVDDAVLIVEKPNVS